MSARIEEIRQENRSGDVSYRDIEWLCSVAEAAEALIERTVPDLTEVGRREARLSRLLRASPDVDSEAHGVC
jgi:hypothetical protein